MKTAICYYYRHHGNTLRVLEAMALGQDVDLVDVTCRATVHLDGYDVVGFASGIYYGKFHRAVLQFASQYLPQGKDVFFVCTYGSRKNTQSIAEVVHAKGSRILGEFGCRGYDTFGPFKLLGGIAKGHPSEDDLRRAVEFYRGLESQAR